MDGLSFGADGLLPVIVQDAADNEVLMLAWANRAAIDLTEETGRAHFFSRSRQRLWRKGETSGNELLVEKILTDCDRDALIYRVRPLGPACHLGTRSCFADGEAPFGLSALASLVHSRVRGEAPEGSYTRRLADSGTDRILRKLGEEFAEVVVAAKNTPQELRWEAADLLYHLLVLLETGGVPFADVEAELAGRHRARAARVEGAET